MPLILSSDASRMQPVQPEISKPAKPWNLCECGGPLLVRYDLPRLRAAWSRECRSLRARIPCGATPLRCRFRMQNSIISLGEGMTPLLPARRTGARIGATDLLIKDEGLNPTGSFKARGLSCAVSMCVELGCEEARHSLGRQRRQRACRLCRRGRARGAYFHAAGRAAGEFHRMQSLWRAGDAGRWPDQRLRPDRRRARADAKAGSISRL